MSQLRATPLLRGDVAGVDDVTCTAPRSGRGELEQSDEAQVIVPRRGVFVVHGEGDAAVVDPTTAVVLGAGEEFAVSHPAAGGDRCTAIGLGAGHAEEVLGDRRGSVRLRPATQLAVGLLAGTLHDRATARAIIARLTTDAYRSTTRTRSTARCPSP